MYYSIDVDPNKQITCLTEGEIQRMLEDGVYEITEEQASGIKQNGLRGYTYDNGLQLKPLVTYSLDKAQIQADGVDTAILTVTASNAPANIEVYFNGVPDPEPLANGTTTIQITSTDPQTVTITADPMYYRFNQLVLEAI
jgi:hypothetical protein